MTQECLCQEHGKSLKCIHQVDGTPVFQFLWEGRSLTLAAFQVAKLLPVGTDVFIFSLHEPIRRHRWPSWLPGESRMILLSLFKDQLQVILRQCI